SLNLRRCTYLTDAGIAHRKKLPNLTYLYLLYNNLGDESLKHLAEVPKLRLLDLRGCTLITDDGLAHLKPLANLNVLKLRSASLSDAGVAHLATLTGLIGLSLEDAAISDEGIASIGKLKELKELQLMRAYGVTDAGLAPLANLNKM